MSEKMAVQQIEPAFYYRVQNGDICVYLMMTKVSKMAIITYDDTESEYAYAVQTFTTNSRYEVENLVFNAERNFHDMEDNPFMKLEDDREAMNVLARIIAVFFKGDGDE